MGQEFRVNTYQNNWQRDAHITTFADGSFLVVWESYFNNYDNSGDPAATYIAAQRYDANGSRVGGERILDFVDYSTSEDVRVTTLSDGGYAVVYAFDDYDSILSIKEKVYVNIYNADGSVRARDIRVDTVPSNDAAFPEVFATANGGFKVVFGVDRSTTLFNQIYSQQFTANGTKVGGNTLVNVNEGQFDEIYARSATLTNGTAITIWNSEGGLDGPGSGNMIRGMLTNVNGAVTRADFGLSENWGSPGRGSGGGYDVAALNNGGFVICHKNYDFDLGLDTEATSYYTVFQFFNAAGQRTSGKFVAFASDDLPGSTRITQLDTGEIVVIWEQDPLPAQDQISDDIYGRVFSANGAPITGVFEISVDADSYDEQSDPEIAALAGGGFVVTYTSESIDNSDAGVAARIYGRATAGNDRVTVDVSGMMLGLAGNDTITGSGRSNMIMGGDGNDRASGLAGADRVGGGNGRDVLVGGDGNDTLTGGQGNDTLTGNAGADRFIFANTANAANRDVITAFSSVDVLALDNAVFRALGAAGNLAPGMFKMIGTGANADSNDRIIYDKRNGVVYYDTNGSGEGGRFAIVELDNRPTVTASDFLVI
jgi:Ca2+-binding RTX toxin-like protein